MKFETFRFCESLFCEYMVTVFESIAYDQENHNLDIINVSVNSEAKSMQLMILINP